jgi:D-alanine-D-alanine ligase
LKVAVIYNEPRNTASEDHWLRRSDPAYHPPSADFVDASEFGVLLQMRSIATALREQGHDVSVFSADDNPKRLCSFLSQDRPDVIFNCCEAILGESKLELNVAAMYELFGIAYTGSAPLALGLALDKSLAKAVFVANGIPTPKHQLFKKEETLDPLLRFPLIVKPVHEDASIGIDAHAIVQDARALAHRARFIQSEFEQPALAEEFIDGRELNVALLATSNGNFETLPISEITFDNMPEGMPRIVSYEAKWVEESPMYQTTVPECPAKIPEDIASEARSIALQAAAAVGLRDYGRVDLRLDAKGHLFVLEANPNPDISEDAGFMRAARASGRTFAGTINEILNCAVERCRVIEHARAIERSKQLAR